MTNNQASENTNTPPTPCTDGVDRRKFIAYSAVAAASASVLGLAAGEVAAQTAAAPAAPTGPFKLPKLPYAYDALEPAIDAKTMEIHYTKHHQGYVDKLNAAVAGHPQLAKMPIDAILVDLDAVPADIRTAVQNNGGGHANHTMFWTLLAPVGNGTKPSPALAKAIEASFGSMDKFKEAFNQAATTRFGSGWAWLVADGDKLEVISSANQDSPLSLGKKPLLGLDVWEHAYYLHYQNRRPEYIGAFWDIVNWDQVSKNFAAK
ncbi:superoxide dismutase [Aeoliella sp. SH292]|uniref:superoxide dismutase n=1 Tax=Aeoliella sp. SH292 TaxID=3454464 RepID=UPI003F97AEBD